MHRDCVSVVVAARDKAPFVRQAIESALSQTHTELEVVVTDDGSSDGTSEILDAVAASDRRVTVERTEGIGAAGARNAAAARSRGSFIAPLDADDLWHPRKLELQLAAFERRPAAGAAWVRAATIDADGIVCETMEPYDAVGMQSLEGNVLLQTLYRPFVAGSAPLIRRELFDAVGGYDTSFVNHEDWELTLRLAERSEYVAVPFYLVAYRIHSGGKSNNVQNNMASARRAMASLRARQPELPASVHRWARADRYLYASARAFSSGRPAHAVWFMLRATTLDPICATRSQIFGALRRAVAPGRGGGPAPKTVEELFAGDVPTEADLVLQRPTGRIERAVEARRRRLMAAAAAPFPPR